MVLAQDLRAAYSDSKGFSTTNLKYMRIFAELYPDFQIGESVPHQWVRLNYRHAYQLRYWHH